MASATPMTNAAETTRAPRVKICGIRRIEDARLAVELGADAIGFIFWRGSRRYVEPAIAGRIAEGLPPTVLRVGVFVDAPPSDVAAVAAVAGLGAVQLHGGERTADYAHLELPLIKAVAVPDGFDPASTDAEPPGVLVLLDAHDPIRRGGTGRTIDWTAAAAVAARRRTILSGGLTAGNVGEAVRAVRPYMIDVSSGVEAAPGEKDAARLRAFFAALGRQRDMPDSSGQQG